MHKIKDGCIQYKQFKLTDLSELPRFIWGAGKIRNNILYLWLYQVLEDNWKMIRDEALAQMDVEEGLFKVETEDLKDSGDWKQFDLFITGKLHVVCY